MERMKKTGGREIQHSVPEPERENELQACPAPDEDGNYVYILQCRDGSLYTGWTTDLPARLAAHNGAAGAAKGAKCTRGRRPVRLVYFEAHATKSEAMSREAGIKRLSRVQKLKLIHGGGQGQKTGADDVSRR